MQQELRLATFNVCNLALPGLKYYEDQEPYTAAEYDAKTSWIAQKIDELDADVIAFQEIFSQAALTEVLAKSRKFRQAHHIGFDSPPQSRPVPGVALISRLPILDGAAGVCLHIALPHQLSIPLPGVESPLTTFTRPVLHARLMLSPGQSMHVFVCHLKSKRPDYRNGALPDPETVGLAVLRSLIRRSTDALGLRLLADKCMGDDHAPVIVMGDFNDVAAAVSTQLVMGTANVAQEGFDHRLYDSYRIQASKCSRDLGYTHVHDGSYETVDHVLVSSEFNPHSPSAIGEVLEVIYLNDHVALKPAEATDHGLVLVRIGLMNAASYLSSGATTPSPLADSTLPESGASPSSAG
ncbi:nuclease [soil metagenome]